MKQELLNHENKYRAVFGVFPRQFELHNWSSDMYEHFFNFLDIFYEGGKIKVTNEKVMALEACYDEEGDKFKYAEFMNRIGKPFDPSDNLFFKKFYIRLAVFMRVVIQYCKKHPQVLSTELVDKIKDKPQYAWCLNNFKVVTTAIGAEVVLQDTKTMSGNMPGKPQASANPESMLLESMVKVAHIYDMIASSLKKKDLEQLTVKEKINALQKLAFIHSATKNFKPNSQVFQQINVYKAGREELEAAIQDFSSEEK